MDVCVLDYMKDRENATEAFSAAISACAAGGGGYVDVPAGEYVSGTVELEDRVFLRLHAGAYLLGSDFTADYRGSRRGCAWSVGLSALVGNNNMPSCEAFILADRKRDCGIVGEGTIDGRRSYNYGYSQEKGRPFLVVFSECERVTVRGVTMRNPGMFTNYFLNCRDVVVDGIRIYSEDSANGDGIDFDGSKNVVISNCMIDAGDDGISLKTLTPGEPCENFVITNCVIRSKYWGAIRIGPESVADIRNIAMSNCVFRECNDGLKLQLCEDSVFEDFCFSNITMSNVTRPFYVTSNSYPMSKYSRGLYPPPGTFRRLTIDNVTAVQSQLYAPPTFDGCFFCGLPDGKIEDVTLSNITLSVPGGGGAAEASRASHAELIDNSEGYPEIMPNMGDYPCAGLYFKNIGRVSLFNVRVSARENDERTAIAAEDVGALDMLYCSAVSCGSLLRRYRADARIFNCTGTITELTGSAAHEWDNFRLQSVEFMNILRRGAKLTELAASGPLVKAYPEGTTKFSLERGEAKYLLLPRVKGMLTVEINGKRAFIWSPPEVYTFYTPVTVELGNLITEERNSLSILPANGTKLAGEPQFRI